MSILLFFIRTDLPQLKKKRADEYGRDYYGPGSTECPPIEKKLPFFHFQKRPESYDILFPFFADGILGTTRWYSWYTDIVKAREQYPWDKKVNKLFWRGSTTGGTWDTQNAFLKPRGKLVKACETIKDKCDAGLVLNPQIAPGVNHSFFYDNFRMRVYYLPMNEWMT